MAAGPHVASGEEIDLSNAKIAAAKLLEDQRIIRRTGQVVDFDFAKIEAAIEKAFVAVQEKTGAKLSKKVQAEEIDKVVYTVLHALIKKARLSTGSIHIEEIQDQVELALLRTGHKDVGESFAAYRAERAAVRHAKFKELLPTAFTVINKDGSKRLLDASEIHHRIEAACHSLDMVDSEMLVRRVVASLHEGITVHNYDRALVLEASTLIESHPNYSLVAARLLLDKAVVEAMDSEVSRAEMVQLYPGHLAEMIAQGVADKRINPLLQSRFNLAKLGKAIKPERDYLLDYLGLQTLYDRYFIKSGRRRIELPQSMWMRVAMGLAIEEDDPTARALEFYEVLSTFRFMNSTPTLFNAGTVFSQLSSCYISTISDDLLSIYDGIKNNAMLAKFAGGLGNDWTPVRAMGSHIHSTGGDSQGVVPFLRVVNDTAIAVNQGGKRKGAVCCYLETWHADIEEFLDLRKNTGDERRRTHDMNTANWIPDLFMQRVREEGQWTLFSPSDVPDLHDLYGEEFKQAYEAYEARFDAGEIPGKRIEAFRLWRSMLGMLFETGHPWITFKDPCNVRSPQSHVGRVHSSNLCTEITLNTNDEEIAVCNLGSVNLARHLNEDLKLDTDLIKDTVTTAMRMLDNVIDINYYSVDKAEHSNLKHRPVGLGQVGFQDALDKMGVGFDTDEGVQFADESTELVCYHAYWASSDLAKERGSYSTFKGSLWDRGVLPLDSLKTLAEERNGKPAPKAKDGWLVTDDLEVNVESKLDWDKLRKKIAKDGMRNSNCIAIAPTATISNIMGTSPCIEPTFQNMYVKSNLSGEFKVINANLVQDLLDEGLWDNAMISDIKARDGELDGIDRIPEKIRARHKTVFNIEQKWLIEAASRRQKWIDQAQSLNIFIKEPTGRKMSEIYMLAWRRGLKTTYYCRTLQASSSEKYTTESTGQQNRVAIPKKAPQACAIDDPECEACQ